MTNNNDNWKTIKPLPPLKNFCNCKYCKVDRCHFWTSLGRRMTGYSTPSWCPLPRISNNSEVSNVKNK